MPETVDADNAPETPSGWTGPRDHLDAGEMWHTGGGIWLRTAVHPDLGLEIVWNPGDDPIEVGIERVEQNEYEMWEPTEQLEAVEYDSDAAALDDLPDLCRRVADEYGD